MAVRRCIPLILLWRVISGARVHELDENPFGQTKHHNADDSLAPPPQYIDTCANFHCPRGKVQILEASYTTCAGSRCEASDEPTCCEDEPASLCSEKAELVLTNVLVNNLGGMGPNKTASQERLTFGNVFPELEEPVNLVISAPLGYTPKNSKRNGANGVFGQINLKAGEMVKLKFMFVSAATGIPQAVPDFLFSILDLDTNTAGQAREYVRVSKYKSYRTAKETDVVAEIEDDNSGTFHGSTSGYGQENPTDLRTLTDHQMRRLVTFQFPSINSFWITFGSTAGKGGRNFFFSGASALYCGTRAYSVALPGTIKFDDTKLHPYLSGYDKVHGGGDRV